MKVTTVRHTNWILQMKGADGSSGGSMRGYFLNVYSEDEIIVGTWINGETIFCAKKFHAPKQNRTAEKNIP